jgi:hypothetical protein
MSDSELLEILKREKTPGELEALQRKILLERLADLLHTLLCPCDHEKDCDYYIPEVSTKPSTAREHWIKQTDALLKKAELDDRALDFILKRLPSLVAIMREPGILRFLQVLSPALIARAEVDRASRPELLPSYSADPLDSA